MRLASPPADASSLGSPTIAVPFRHIAIPPGGALGPDICGSMVQAVALREARGNLGALYERAEHADGAEPILPRRSPRDKLDEGSDGPTLLDLGDAMARLRGLDAATVRNRRLISYEQMPAIKRRSAADECGDERRSDVPIGSLAGSR